MADFMQNDSTFHGETTFDGAAIANGGLTIGPGGSSYGSPPGGGNAWPTGQRVVVADTAERAALVAWRNANAPISAAQPLLVWRVDGSFTGLAEMTVDGTNWYAESPLPGDIEMSLSSAVPYGWVAMEGQLLADAAATYPALWAAASPSLRVGGSLRVPDMRGRSPMGAGTGAGLTTRNLGDTVGAESVALSTSELPAHNHSGTTNNPDRSLDHDHWTRFNHNNGANISGTGYAYEIHDPAGGAVHRTSNVSQAVDPAAGASLAHKHTFTTGNTGEGVAHNNIQPSLVAQFRMKL